MDSVQPAPFDKSWISEINFSLQSGTITAVLDSTVIMGNGSISPTISWTSFVIFTERFCVSPNNRFRQAYFYRVISPRYLHPNFFRSECIVMKIFTNFKFFFGTVFRRITKLTINRYENDLRKWLFFWPKWLFSWGEDKVNVNDPKLPFILDHSNHFWVYVTVISVQGCWFWEKNAVFGGKLPLIIEKFTFYAKVTISLNRLGIKLRF